MTEVIVNALAPTHKQIVALSPRDLVPAQAETIRWCRQKIASLGAELREQRQNLRQAKAMKWKYSGWTNVVTKTKKRMIYFTKIMQALRAGYLIVPNFDVDVIAVRVETGSRPVEEVGEIRATPDVLLPGEGQYVDNKLLGHQEAFHGKDRNGKDEVTYHFHPDSWNTELDFPATLVKPSILAETNRAMALHLFDRIGIVRTGRRSDPIVVGHVIDPATPRRYRKHTVKCVTFFIAWYLNTEDL